ncbi:MAG: glycosyltransferase [Acidobacteriaceae bacterium]
MTEQGTAARGSVILASLRFNPAFVQHLVAFGKALQALDYGIVFLLDPGYDAFAELAALGRVVHETGSLQGETSSHAIFLNTAVQNLEVAGSLKRRGTRIVYVYHEPWKPRIAYLMTDGFFTEIRAAAAHRVSVPLLKLADTVILESGYALGKYGEYDGHRNRNAVYFPQIYDDEAGEGTAERAEARPYFSYIGNISRVHGFDQYVRFIRECFRRREEARFLIASRLPLPESVLRDRIIGANADRIEIRCGRPLQNHEINRCYAQSAAVWNLYRRSMQSGVLPKAFMFGTPVIASRVGSFPEYVEEGVTGRFASAKDHDGIRAALDDIRARAGEYAAHCRQAFLETFYYKARIADLEKLLAR